MPYLRWPHIAPRDSDLDRDMVAEFEHHGLQIYGLGADGRVQPARWFYQAWRDRFAADYEARISALLRQADLIERGLIAPAAEPSAPVSEPPPTVAAAPLSVARPARLVEPPDRAVVRAQDLATDTELEALLFPAECPGEIPGQHNAFKLAKAHFGNRCPKREVVRALIASVAKRGVGRPRQ